MKNTGRNDLDNQKDLLIARYDELIYLMTNENCSMDVIKRLRILNKDLELFRISLGSSRGTDEIENVFGWRSKFDEMKDRISELINAEGY